MTKAIRILNLVAKRDVGNLKRGMNLSWLETRPYNVDDFADITGLDDEECAAKFAELFPDWFPPEREPPKPPTRLEIVQDMVEQCRPIFAGKPPEVQGLALAELLAIWLAGHPSDAAADLLNLHTETVIQLVADKKR